jgi:hypothetical protein
MTEPQPSSPVQTAGSQRRAFIHVGAPKTGTTYLQGVLWRNQAALAAAGVQVLGKGRGDHYRAGHDLREIPFDPRDPRMDWTGAWDIVARLAADCPAPSVVISDEHLASLTPEQARRAVEGLAPREVHVVYATRNLPGLLPSEWQEYVKHGSVHDYPTWARKVLRHPRTGPGKWFWSVHDPVDVVRRWSTVVPLAQIHVITMPPPSAGPDELWRRFAQVLGVEPSVATDFDVAANPSLGYAETEVLRRVNLSLPDDFPRWHYVGLVRDMFAAKILSAQPSKGRPKLPAELERLVAKRSELGRTGLAESGCEIVGDLDELAAPASSASDSESDAASVGASDGARPTSAELLDISVRSSADLIVRMARMRDERRRSESRFRAQMQSRPAVRRLRGRLIAMEQNNRAAARLGDWYRSARGRTVDDPPDV